MLQLLPCPHCGQQSLLPSDTSLEASLKCPHCSQQLVLGEALLQQFSSWEVIDDPASLVPSDYASVEPSRPTVVPVPQLDSDQDELQLSTSVAPASSEQPTQNVSVRPYTHFEYERMRRKQKSPIWSVVPVVLGGLAAFPIALLILWWGLGKDVGEMGPQVAEFVPWIVPQQFHPVKEVVSGPFSLRRGRPGPSGLPRPDDSGLTPTPAPMLPTASASNADGDAAVMQAESETNQAPSSLPPGGIMPAATQPSITAEVDGSTPAQSEQNQNVFESIRLANTQLLELAVALESKSADRKERVLEVFDRLSRLAIDFSMIDGNNANLRTIKEQMQPLARNIKQHSEIQSLLDRVAEIKSGEPKVDDRTGIAMTLEIDEVERLQELWQVAGTHKLTQKTMIEIPRFLAPALAAGQKLFVLGVLTNADPNDKNSHAVLRVSYLHSL